METTESKFVTIIQANQKIVHKVCRMYCTNEEERKDLFQEILIQLWQAFPSFREEAKLSTWLYQIALNVAVSQLRKSYKKIEFKEITTEQENISDDEADDGYQEKLKLLNWAIQHISEIEKALLLLYLEEHSTDEIANIMGITTNNVRVKLHRIQEKIKQLLSDKKHGKS